ncbi:MAG: pyridoxal kinase PdxY [Rectinemataceae bacterium]|nr:pyridoxal kinase PdxY [Rectinemataceae bacterium]
MKSILSIQSQVVYGHVGNSAAVFPLQRMGYEVLPVNTVQFSNHPGYGRWKGMVFPGSHIAELWQGLEELGSASSCDAVLSGYLGSLETGEAILHIVADVKRTNSEALYCCDPVMGDSERGLYVRQGIPEFFAHKALREASIIKPNLYEAEVLSGLKIEGLGGARKACSILHGMGPSIVLITSYGSSALPSTTIATLLSFGEEAYLVQTPRFAFPLTPHGGGDLVSALFIGNYLETQDPVLSLERMASAVHRVFELTFESHAQELAIIAAQDAFSSRQSLFRAERIW